VTLVERQSDGGFTKVELMPLVPVDRVRHVLVLEPLKNQLPPPPEPEPAPAPAAKGKAKKVKDPA
jgi:rod shape-determining protein MreC